MANPLFPRFASSGSSEPAEARRPGRRQAPVGLAAALLGRAYGALLAVGLRAPLAVAPLAVALLAVAPLAACATAQGTGDPGAPAAAVDSAGAGPHAAGLDSTGAGRRAAGADRGSTGYRVYVGTESADAVTVVEGGTWKVLGQIPVGISPEDIEGVHALTVAPDAKHWYITLAHGFPFGTLWKFTTAGDSLVAKAELGNFPATIGITPDSHWAFVVNYNLHGDPKTDTVSAVYLPTMTEVAEIPVCVKPHGLDVSRDGRTVVVTCTRDDALVVLDAGALREKARGTLRLPEEAAAGKDCYATGVQIVPDGRRAYVSCGHANEVRVVDLATLEITARIPECEGAYLMRLDPESERLWVPCRSGQDVIVIDTSTDEIVGRIATTREFPHTVGFTPDGRWALLTQESRGVVPGAMDVVDRKTLEKVATADVGLQATGIGIAAE